MASRGGHQETGAQSRLPAVAPPSLPKGGGAIRGIGEKFTANPITGTNSLSIPIPLSPGRAGFGPQLSITYDSGSGNGPFGIGWAVAIPAITRKTDKGLPLYIDAEDSDVFLLSGAEDLVPVLDDNGDRLSETTDSGYLVHHYRPRIEASFARIERWTRRTDPSDVHWRSWSKENILTIYGSEPESRITDPVDPSRIFSWLICESRDDRGNAIAYQYKPEDGAGIDLAMTSEQNRGPAADPRRAANRYLKRIRYGNRTTLLDAEGSRPEIVARAMTEATEWLFEAVFDYGEHDPDNPTPRDAGEWLRRHDPFSVYRAGFEVRAYRLCQRVLMFHHFPGEAGVGSDCLVRSLDIAYRSDRDDDDDARRGHPVASFIASVTHHGYVRGAGGGYIKRAIPPLEFEYSRPEIDETVREIDPHSMENLPIGVDGSGYQWVDLDGEGISGILTEQASGWFYKAGLGGGRFAPARSVASQPAAVGSGGGKTQLLDLAGDGTLDLVELAQQAPGLYERTPAGDWENHRAFTLLPNVSWEDPNLRFVDLDGDGRADVLVTEREVFTWYPSLGEAGFGPARRTRPPTDEEQGPHLIFADATESIFLADMSGDGLTDLVRIRNGEVCYWPNLGHGRFGAKVAMDRAPLLDHLERFDPRRLRLADIDGSGNTDIIYLGADSVHLCLNESGNSWSEPRRIDSFPRMDSVSSVSAVDLLGNGTACLVWSSPLPGEARRAMRYIDLTGGKKPHLLTRTVNNLGAETLIRYAASTLFYLQDKLAGRPWITSLPFPVHVVERVETVDRITGNRFVTRYAYHHGHFDGVEREFRGFGLVEQWDAEAIPALRAPAEAAVPEGGAGDAPFNLPPIQTKTWFHTGNHLGRGRVSSYFAGLMDGADAGEYYREPGLSDEQARALLLDDTILPAGLSTEEEQEACRALKGAMLRQEVYALDGSSRAAHPYTVTERSYDVRVLQRRQGNRHAVFFPHARETITYQYERSPNDPRVMQTLTLEVDSHGNVLKEAAVAHGRRSPDPMLPQEEDRETQARMLITYTENSVTNAIDTRTEYRAPLPCEARTFELTGYLPVGVGGRLRAEDFVRPDAATPNRLVHIFDSEISYEVHPTGGRQRRLIAHSRTLYRKNDLTAFLKVGRLESMALPGESYQLAFTDGLLKGVFRRTRSSSPSEDLLPDPGAVLGGAGIGRGGYVSGAAMKAVGLFASDEPEENWWIPSGRVFHSTDAADTPAEELAQARAHFFIPRRLRDLFASDSTTLFDPYDLLPLEARDALDNRVTAGQRRSDGTIDPSIPGNDYRVLQARRVMDPNGNSAEVSFDALGLVVGTARMGKPSPAPLEGDSLEGFQADLDPTVALGHIDEPLGNPASILQKVTTRLVYDLFAYHRTRHLPSPAPAVVYALAREEHAAASGGRSIRFQHGFTYTDGFGRIIQRKMQAEPGLAPVRDDTGAIVLDPDGRPVMSASPVSPRWVGSGWIIYNNKGKPVRQYEPFFSDAHRFEGDVRAGVGPILFYDPLVRVVATLHPNHTYEKIVFDAWSQTSYDVNDTAAPRGAQTGDPRTDPDVQGLLHGYFATQPPGWRTWFDLRRNGALGLEERDAAASTSIHVDTPVTVHLDPLGRVVLSVARNRFERGGVITEDEHATRVQLDIEGNQRAVRDSVHQDGDPRGRLAMLYDYDMTGTRIHQCSMESGERWNLRDAGGESYRAWDSLGRAFRTEFDRLRRPVRTFALGADPAHPDRDVLTERLVYGEQHPDGVGRNLRAELWLRLDQAGAVYNDAHDFKGNLRASSRRFTRAYQGPADWSTVDDDHAALPTLATDEIDLAALEARLAPLLEVETFRTSTVYDALDRPVLQSLPDGTLLRSRFNEAGLLEGVDGNLRGETVGGAPAWTPFVSDVDYDARGMRTLIDVASKNGRVVRTAYTYDSDTARLAGIETRRGIDPMTEGGSAAPGERLQALRYTYDPIGNITRIRDSAQQTVYFGGEAVSPHCGFVYDALYRLTEATGREHIGQTGHPESTWNDAFRVTRQHPGDGLAMRTYTERYEYDAAGNILRLIHQAAGDSWTRAYSYVEASQLEPAKRSNRLTATEVGSSGTEPYGHDPHGNLTFLRRTGNEDPDTTLHWDYADRLQHVDLGGGGNVYYVYDGAGQRVRKVWEKGPGLIEERLYLGGIEVFLRRSGGETLRRETLHIMDGHQRVALVETRTEDTAGGDPAPRQLVRYQFGNHLVSANLELDDQAQIIAYEEYSPYGSTTYQAVRSQTETPRRYRYTGKERDEETGLYFHGARYYIPWLGRWSSCDPLGLSEGMNPYLYTSCNPIRFRDPTGLAEWGDLEEEHQSINSQIYQRFRNDFLDAEKNIPFDPKKYKGKDGFFRWRRDIGVEAHRRTQSWVKKQWSDAVTELHMKGEGTRLDIAFPNRKLTVELKSSMTGLMDSAEQQARQVAAAGREGWAYSAITASESKSGGGLSPKGDSYYVTRKDVSRASGFGGAPRRGYATLGAMRVAGAAAAIAGGLAEMVSWLEFPEQVDELKAWGVNPLIISEAIKRSNLGSLQRQSGQQLHNIKGTNLLIDPSTGNLYAVVLDSTEQFKQGDIVGVGWTTTILKEKIFKDPRTKDVYYRSDTEGWQVVGPSTGPLELYPGQ